MFWSTVLVYSQVSMNCTRRPFCRITRAFRTAGYPTMHFTLPSDSNSGKNRESFKIQTIKCALKRFLFVYLETWQHTILHTLCLWKGESLQRLPPCLLSATSSLCYLCMKGLIGCHWPVCFINILYIVKRVVSWSSKSIGSHAPQNSWVHIQVWIGVNQFFESANHCVVGGREVIP